MATKKKQQQQTAHTAPVASEESSVLKSIVHRLSAGGFDQSLDLRASEPGMSAALVWGRHDGIDTPRILALVLPAGAWGRANADEVQGALVLAPGARDRSRPVPAVRRREGRRGQARGPLRPRVPAAPDRQAAELSEINDYKRIKADPTYRWSMRMYDRLMKGFNALHERIYQTHKDRVNGKNDIIEEVAKLLFLESFRLHHDDGSSALTFEHQGKKLSLKDVFTAAYVKANGARRSRRSSPRSSTSSCTPTTSSPTTPARSTPSSTRTPTCA
jgi:type I restriction enzyme M protein